MTLESVRLASIPVIAIAPDAPLSGNAPALLQELAECVRKLLEKGESAAIDLQALPLTPADHAWLKEHLGEGEVAITLQAQGESTLTETACPGVWWVSHRNEQGAVMSEFIEVTYVPTLIQAHPDDVKTGLTHLETFISELG